MTGVDKETTSDTYSYDENGNTLAPAASAGVTCRVENGQTYDQSYNAENRFSMVLLVSGTCEENGSILAGWNFIYDADGTRVEQVYTDGDSTLTTYYFAGGAYEVQTGGAETMTKVYYAIAGQTVAVRTMTTGSSTLNYLLTDHLGSVVAVTDEEGALVSEQRYLPFGQVRSDVGSVTETDFGYTGQRDLDAQQNAFSLGLMDYNARFYDVSINRFIQPDTITPGGNSGIKPI